MERASSIREASAMCGLKLLQKCQRPSDWASFSDQPLGWPPKLPVPERRKEIAACRAERQKGERPRLPTNTCARQTIVASTTCTKPVTPRCRTALVGRLRLPEDADRRRDPQRRDTWFLQVRADSH